MKASIVVKQHDQDSNKEHFISDKVCIYRVGLRYLILQSQSGCLRLLDLLTKLDSQACAQFGNKSLGGLKLFSKAKDNRYLNSDSTGPCPPSDQRLLGSSGAYMIPYRSTFQENWCLLTIEDDRDNLTENR